MREQESAMAEKTSKQVSQAWEYTRLYEQRAEEERVRAVRERDDERDRARTRERDLDERARELERREDQVRLKTARMTQCISRGPPPLLPR